MINKKALFKQVDPLYAGINSLPIIIIEINKAGKTIHLSGKGLITAGINAKKSLGHSITDLFGQRKQVHKAFTQALIGKLFHGEISGSKHSFEVWISPQKNAQFEIMGAVCMAIDITKRKKTQQALIKSKKEAELAQSTEKKFMANISHQMRTPLNAIIGLTELLIDTPLDKVQEKYLQSIYMASNDLLAIVNDVLDFAKISAGIVKPSNKPFALTNLFTEIKETLQSQIKETKTKVNFHIDKNIPLTLLGDQLRIKQILLNLISNALKFTPHNSPSLKKNSKKGGDLYSSFKKKTSLITVKKVKGEVNIRAVFQEKDEKFIQIAFIVSDNGIGIPQSQLKNVFRSFTQLNKQLDKFKGVGLGLAITRKLVDALGGSIMVTSKINKGTTFTCVLPCRTISDYQNSGKLKDKQKTLKKEGLKGLSILLIEDNPLNQLVAQDLLFHQQANVTTVDRGSKALNMIKKKHFDVILTDVNLPGRLDGIQTIKRIRQLRKNISKVPIVAVSAYHQTTHSERCLNAGANAYLIKPYTQVQLITTIKSVITNQKKILNLKKRSFSSVALFTNKFITEKSLRLKLMKAFLQQTPAYLKQLTLATKQQNKEEINRIIHQLRPSLKYLELNILDKQLVQIKELQLKKDLKDQKLLGKKMIANFVEECLHVLENFKAEFS